MIVELFVLTLITLALNKFLAPKPEQTAAKKATFSSFTFPHADEAAPIPIFWGKVRIKAPVVISAKLFKGEAIREEVNGDHIVVGYQYRLAMQFLLGSPGARADAATKPAQLKRFWIGERQVWSGSIATDDDIRYVKKPSLLGGQNQGGGVEGLISFLPGSFTQTNNNFLKSALALSHANQDVAYRGQAVVSLLGVEGVTSDVTYDFPDGYATTSAGLAAFGNLQPRGWMVGEAPTLDGYSFEVYARTDTTTFVGGPLGPIGEDANPVNVLYDILTNPWDRLGRDPSTIDTASFRDAGVTLATEGNGFSLVLTNEVNSRDAIRLLLEQMDAVLYDDVGTGKLKLKLVRDDYDVDDLDTIDPSSGIEVVEYSAGTWDGTYNQVRVTFTDRSKRYQDGPAIAQDQANYYATGSRLRSKDVHYPGCTLKENADRLASRDLKALSLPLAKMKIAVDRNAYTKRPGDVFKFTWPKFNNITDVVFRVIKYDLGKPGTPDAERVILDCVQDRFAMEHSVFRLPQGNFPPITQGPYLPTDTHQTEAPLWLSSQAQLAGRIVDAFTGGRFIHLAVPRTGAVALHAELRAVETESFARDIEPQPYPGRALVSVDYERHLEPYDTGTGLVIEALEDWVPAAATPEDIALLGKNLILVGDTEAGKHEFMTFETVNDNLDGTFTLGNVGRGALDTSPLLHPAGTRVWSLHISSGAASSRVGRVSFEYAKTATARMPAVGLGRAQQASAAPDVDATELTSGLRIARPYPVADLNIGCASLAIGDTPSKFPSQLVEGGLDLTWKRRNRLSPTIIRGDDADEEPEADTTYKIIAKTRGDTGEPDDGEVNNVLNAVLTSQPYTTTDYEDALLPAYGVLDVGVRSQAPLRASNPAAPLLGAGWMDTVLQVDAPHWRNLLANGRFDQDLDGWTTTAGTPQTATSSSGLGATGYYLTGNVDEDDIEIQQTVDIRGFVPGNLKATLQFYHFSADAGDTCTITLESLDSAHDVLDTIDSGVITPDTVKWGHAEISIPALDPQTTYLRVTILGQGSGGGVSVLITEVILRVGQVSSQLLAHPNFDDFDNGTHAITGWTNADDYFFGITGLAPYYTGDTYAIGGNVATSEIRQDVAIPVGWEEQAIAVLELGRSNLSADGDTGEVILEVLNNVGAVEATATTGATVGPVGTWERQRLTLEIPDSNAVTLRVRLLAVRATGSGYADTAFSDLDLRIHKALSPTKIETHALDTPTSQPVPPDFDYFDRGWPDVVPPSYAFYNGAKEEGLVGNEPVLGLTDEDAATPPTVSGKFVGAYDATRNGSVIAKCFEFPPGCDAGFTVGDRSFANFSSTDAWALLVQLKVANETRGPKVICSRVTDGGGVGWELILEDDTNRPFVQITGADGNASVTGVKGVGDRAVRVVGVLYDPDAQEISIVEQDDITTASTAAIGEFAEETPSVTLTIGAPTGNGGDNFEGQIANLFMWKGTEIDSDDVPSADDLQTMITQGLRPSGSNLFQTRTDDGLATIVGTDDDGVVVSRFGNDQFAFAYHTELDGDDETGLGFPFQPKVVNLIADWQQGYNGGEGDWHNTGSATVETNYGVGPEGFVNTTSIIGDNTGGRELRNITAGSSANKMVAFFARTTETDGHIARVMLDNESGVNKDLFDFLPTTTWQIYWNKFTAWDDSTPTCRLRWMASNDGTPHQLEIAGPFYLSESEFQLLAIPVGHDDTTPCGYDDASMGLGVWANEATVAEGEIMITGVAINNPPDDSTIFQASSGGTGDFRILYNSGGSPSLRHDDGGGPNYSSTAVPQDWDVLWTIRGRWCLAGLLDASSVYAGVLFGDVLSAPSDYGRTAAWTLSGNAMDDVVFGSSEFGSPMPMIVRRVVLRTRERRLA